ncbi:MAG TPA: hypothetical protein VEF04_07225, partial [Blastocatellia bacterium]|nr:hypothetical protein [Blastocatellia bacterium]
AGPETSLCHFNNSMGMNPDKDALPQTITKTFDNQTVVLSVVAPTEEFAVAAGYDAKGTVSIDGTDFMVLYWGGEDESSKGFMLENSQGFGSGELERVTMIQWDRTTATQTVKVWGARWAADSGYLQNYESDDAMYGEGSFNTDTNAVSVQGTFLTEPRGGGAADFACYRIFATGIKGGAMEVAKTDDAHNLAGHSKTFAVKSGTGAALEMDGVELIDSVSTPNICQNDPDDETCNDITDFSFVQFTKSCNDIYTGGATGGPLESGDVDLTLTPSDIF